MLERADDEVTSWARDVLPDADVSLGPPVAQSEAPVVSLHLLGLGDLPAARGPGPVARQVNARYLVTATAPEPQTAHRLLGTLLFAAMDEPRFELGFDPAPAELWRAAGAPPAACFSVALRVRLEPEERRAPPVHGPIVVQGEPLGTIDGLVVGPGDIPIPDAFIVLPKLAVSTRSDRRGRFRFAAVPTALPTDVVVRAKASEFPFTIAGPPGSEPVVLRLALSEG